MKTVQSDALVFFGATGDLAYKKIFPALYALVRRQAMTVPIIGVGRSQWSVEELQKRARDSLKEHGDVDPEVFKRLCSLLRYVSGDYQEASLYTKIRQALGSAQRPLYYLAIPPSVFPVIVKGLTKAKAAADARIIIEKPFGRDLASARELNHILTQHFSESAIYRIDHYLGKEPVQNLVYFRFANPFIQEIWNHEYIASVQITMAEKFGVAGRGKFYEETGAIRDVVQNHMLQVIACLGMECPASEEQEAWRDARGQLLKAVRPLSPKDVVRGQFRGYLNEPGVAKDSKVETMAALRFQIDNERWRGVPFYVRAGKCLPVSATEVWVSLKAQRSCLLGESAQPRGNHLRFRLSPDVVIGLGTSVKKPGEQMLGECVELLASHQPAGEMDPYERLIGDASVGDGMLFARSDSIEEAWRIVDPVLGDSTPVYPYDQGTWGPPEAATLTPEGGWHDPKAPG